MIRALRLFLALMLALAGLSTLKLR